MALIRAAQMHGSYDERPNANVVTHLSFNSPDFYNRDYVEQALFMQNTVYGVVAPDPHSELWAHFDFSPERALSNSASFRMHSPNGDVIWDLFRDGQGLVLRVHPNGNPVVISPQIPLPNAVVATIDVQASLDVGGSTFSVYLNDALFFSITAPYVFSEYEMDAFRLPCIGLRGYVSQVILADESTVGWRLATVGVENITGFGADRDWTGSGVFFHPMSRNLLSRRFFNLNSTMATGAAGQRSSTPPSYTPLATGPQNIAGLVVSATTQNDPGSAVNDMAAFFNSPTDGITVLDLFDFPKDGDYHTRIQMYENNPANGSPWTLSYIDDVEIGIISL